MQFRALLLLTIHELRAKKIVVGVFLISTLIWIMLSLALNLDIVDGTLAGLRIFGEDANVSSGQVDPATGDVIQQGLTLERFVIDMSSFVAGASYWVGILLALFATGPLLAGLLERGRVDLVLSKPVHRLSLLAGHVVGVWATAAVLFAYLMGAVWLVVSFKSGIWNWDFLIVIAMVICMFAVVYSIITVISVGFQSGALALVVAYGILFVSIILGFREQLEPQINPPWRQVYVTFYHLLPNFSEVTVMVTKLAEHAPVASWYPFFSSIAFGVVLYAAAGYWLMRRDY